MAQQIAIDRALLDAQPETRGENILKLHPEQFDVEFFGFHDLIQRWNGDATEAEAPTSVLSVVHLFLSFDCRLLAVAQRPPRRKKKTLGMQRPEPEVTEGKTLTKLDTG